MPTDVKTVLASVDCLTGLGQEFQAGQLSTADLQSYRAKAAAGVQAIAAERDAALDLITGYVRDVADAPGEVDGTLIDGYWAQLRTLAADQGRREP